MRYPLSITKAFDSESKILTVYLSGDINSEAKILFQAAYADHLKVMHSCVLDLTKVNMIDSFGIGLLIILSNESQHYGFSINISNPPETIKKTLDAAHIFKILGADKR